MLDKRYMDLFQHLKEDQYQTALYLAEKIETSDKTARVLLNELNDILEESGAHIEVKHGQGYRLQIKNHKKFEKFKRSLSKEYQEKIPNTPEERVQFLKEYLLNQTGYCKLDQLSELLYISRKTITNDLKKVEEDFDKYNIKLIRTNHGIKVQGEEFDLRLCQASCLAMKYGSISLNEEEKQQMDDIALCVNPILQEHQFRMSDVALQNLLIHIFVSIERIKEEHEIVLNDEQLGSLTLTFETELIIANEIAEKLEQRISVSFNKSEIKYLAIHLAGKRMLDGNKSGKNLVISGRIDQLVTEILEKIYESFKIDFRDNLDLRMSLSQHIVPLEVRLKFDMTMKNPLLNEIKERFLFAYSIATFACGIIGQHYNKLLDENEIAYFAMSFELALQRDKYNIRKKNILIVCSSGKGSAQLLKHQYLERFGNYINEIETCDVHTLASRSLDNIDYIFTTVPIKAKVKVPILEVQYFLENKDAQHVFEVLTRDTGENITQYYSESLFFADLDLSTKEEVLQYMCQRIQEIEDVPDDFQDAVFARERLAPTEFGNFVAIPHPSRTLSKKTFACVAILKKPIIWEKQEVQVVFLVSIEDQPSKEIQKFYKTTSKLLIHKNYINELRKKKDFETLIRLLNTVESEMDY
ncbi:BglG family transcription antiterminator [Niallia sp. Krafla_26]|uniref:BglG family transcription antiterminator n=1 Tax=Niallia sp. Krafla_26 TaxID=3064703 RepID=UPI003D174BAD